MELMQTQNATPLMSKSLQHFLLKVDTEQFLKNKKILAKKKHCTENMVYFRTLIMLLYIPTLKKDRIGNQKQSNNNFKHESNYFKNIFLVNINYSYLSTIVLQDIYRKNICLEIVLRNLPSFWPLLLISSFHDTMVLRGTQSLMYSLRLSCKVIFSKRSCKIKAESPFAFKF